MIFAATTILMLSFIVFILFSGEKYFSWIFSSVFFVSSIYYGLGGVWYWGSVRDGVFVGADWFGELGNIAVLFAATQALVFFYLSIFLIIPFSFMDRGVVNEINYRQIKFYSFVCFLLCGFVYVVGSGLKDGGGSVSDNPALLIIYQFTEFPIALILSLIAVEKYKKIALGLLFFYIIFCILVGFRYRIFLVVMPIFFAWLICGSGGVFRRVSLAMLFVLSVATIFSAMTISREKFSGINIDAIYDASFDDIMYGFFADTNIIFGLASSLANFGVTMEFAGFSPIYDVFVQYVPRFLFPEKNLYSHLWDVNYGIAMSIESMNSATAMPFFGEYYSMFGWIGYFFGVMIYSFVVAVFLIHSKRVSKNVVNAVIGAALVSAFFGYYYYSRGSIAQISKGIVFVLVPYFFISRRLK